MGFESKLNGVRVGGNKSERQQSEIDIIRKIYKSREEVIKFYSSSFKIANKAACDAKHEKGLKIFNPK